MFGCQNGTAGTHLHFEMIAPQQAVLLQVKNDKTVSYGGGVNAVEGKTTWQGEMNAKQQSTYTTLIENTGWFITPPKNDENAGTGHYKIRVRSTTISEAFTLPLSDNKATLLYDFLLQVASERFLPHLDTLPKPQMDVIIDRKLKTK